MMVQEETLAGSLAVECCAWVASHFGHQPIVPRSYFDTTDFDATLIRLRLFGSGTARSQWHGDFISCGRIF
jgi:hypothetical protein